MRYSELTERKRRRKKAKLQRGYYGWVGYPLGGDADGGDGGLAEEVLDEVSSVPEIGPGDEWAEEDALRRRFENMHPERVGRLTDGMEFWLAETPTGFLYAFAVDAEGEPIGCLSLMPRGENVVRVEMIYVLRKHREKGIAYALYLAVLRRGFDIVSDDMQTPGGKAIWRKLADDYRVAVSYLDSSGEEHDDPDDIDFLYDDPDVGDLIARWRG